ncbi:hypothetical protein IC582_026430 [Cucumis melo]
MFEEFKQTMMTEFEMTNLGMMHYFLDIEVIQSVAEIFINQKKYALEILDRFQMKNCNSATIPVEPNLKLTKDREGKKISSTLYKQMVGSLMYLTATRPDIMYAVSSISRFMKSPTKFHLLAAKRILRYIKGTSDLGMLYQRRRKLNLVGFSDSDYAGDLNDRKSISGYVFMLGSEAISWSSKKQPIVTLSTTEAELVVATSCACQAIWLRNILENLNYKQEEASIIHYDNTSTIKLSRNPVLHERSKHIDIRYHYLRDFINDGIINLSYCKSEDQVTDILTKPLKLATFLKL